MRFGWVSRGAARSSAGCDVCKLANVCKKTEARKKKGRDGAGRRGAAAARFENKLPEGCISKVGGSR